MADLAVFDAAFPGRAAYDSAVSRALLREVAAGKRTQTLRLYQPDDVLAFSTTDLRRAGFPRALEAARSAGFDVALRLAGGSAAVFHRETLAFAWCTPEIDERAGIRARFERVSAWVARALGRLGIDARVGEVPGAYCPGDYSVNAEGRAKLMGVGQRVVRGAAHTGGVLVVKRSERVREVLTPVYEALALPYDPTTTGAVEDFAPDVTLGQVREALLAALPEDVSPREAVFDPATLEHARRYEDAHEIGAKASSA